VPWCFGQKVLSRPRQHLVLAAAHVRATMRAVSVGACLCHTVLEQHALVSRLLWWQQAAAGPWVCHSEQTSMSGLLSAAKPLGPLLAGVLMHTAGPLLHVAG
jgi:hypothetical protein